MSSIYNYFFTESNASVSPLIKLKKHKLFPFIHENTFNFYNRNTIKMKKLKQKFEEEVYPNSDRYAYSNTKDRVKKHAQLITTSNRSSINVNSKHNGLTHPHDPLVFLTTGSEYEYVPTEVDSDFCKLKIINSEYISQSINQKPRDRGNILGDLIYCVDDLKINSLEDTDYERKDNWKVTNLLDKLNKNKEKESNNLFVTKINEAKIQKSKNILLAHSYSPSDINYRINYQNIETNVKINTTNLNLNRKFDRPRNNNIKLINSSASNYTNKNLGHLNQFKQKMKLQYSKSPFISKTKRDNPFDIDKEYVSYQKKTIIPKSFINKISSFGVKLNTELGKISGGYGRLENHVKFSDNPLVGNYFTHIRKFDNYKNLKVIESRSTHNYRFKLAPLNASRKYDRFDKFCDKFYMKKES